MKILIAYSNANQLHSFFEEVGKESNATNCSYKHLNIDFIETGFTTFETAYKMALALEKKSYHLVLYAGLGNSLNKNMTVGMVLNVINDLPFQIGKANADGFTSAYALSWLDKTQKPHVRGSFINMSSSYFNVFLPFMKTASLTCSLLGGNEAQIQEKIERYPIHIETSNGVAFQYACLSKATPFYQLRAIEENLILKNQDKVLALNNLNHELKKIMDLL